MRVIIVGASGRVGSEVVRALRENHEIVKAGRSSGDLTVDYTDPDSVREMFEALGTFDALVATVGGDSVFKPYEELQDDDFRYGFERKILGQLRLLRIGAPFAADGASFTLSTGYLSDYPNPWSLATGPFNAALNTLVRKCGPDSLTGDESKRRKRRARRRTGYGGTTGSGYRRRGSARVR